MTRDLLQLSIQKEIAYLTLNREESLNALTHEMVQELYGRCREIEASSARALILTGAGSKSFCAGGDIKDWSKKHPSEFAWSWLRHGHEAFDALARLRQPVIAVLNGHTLGGGLELAACADYRIAEKHVKIGQPETGLGIIPGWSGTQRLTRRFGAQLVRRMALFGEIFSAQHAFELGLVDQVADQGAGLNQAKKLAEALLQRGATATELTKVMINSAEGEEGERVAEMLAGWIAAQSDELSEGVSAFHEKRTPKFRNES